MKKREVKKFLPLTISTDPEENLDVAAVLWEAGVQVDWFWSQVGEASESFPPTCGCSYCQTGDAKPFPYWTSAGGTTEQVFHVMQMLAYTADVLATRQGR